MGENIICVFTYLLHLKTTSQIHLIEYLVVHDLKVDKDNMASTLEPYWDMSQAESGPIFKLNGNAAYHCRY